MEKKKNVSLDNFEMYVAMRKIADMVFEYTNPHQGGSAQPWLEDRRNEEVNPFYNQTADGIFLELYHGVPNKVWTPWGQYGFGGSSLSRVNQWDEILPSILERLGAILHKAKEVTKMGEFGPVYVIRKIDEIELPEPVELDHSAYDSYEDVKKAWKKLTKQYQ